MTYVDTTAVKNALAITGSGQDTQIGVYISSAKALIDSFLEVESLESQSYSETHEYPHSNYGSGRDFMLAQLNPTALTSIDGSAISEYFFKGSRLVLKDSIPSISDFPYHHTIVYTAGYATIPNSIKQAMLSIIGTMLSEAKQSKSGVESFSQDKLSITYGSASSKKYITESVVHLLKPYRRSHTILTGPQYAHTLISSVVTPA